MAGAASAHQAATASREQNSQQRSGRTRRTSADPQLGLRGPTATAADAPAVLQTLSRLQQLADASPQVAQLRRLQALAVGRSAPVAQLASGPEEEELVQGKFATAELQPQLQQAPRVNNTGLPDQLKSGIESLSGLSMDHVRVHYNSSQPAQLNALAYAQGSDIHLASGQEQHLPHEAWHVVQQAQGRVLPTLQMQEGVPVNDDVGLEREADVMGAKALQRAALREPSRILANGHSASAISQRKIDKDQFARLNSSIVSDPSCPRAHLQRDADQVKCLVRRAAGGRFEVAASDVQTIAWVRVDEKSLQELYTWDKERVDYDLSKDFESKREKRKKSKTMGNDKIDTTSSGNSPDPLTISEFKGDDLAMVHHTKGGGSAPHLTVENAHISALHHIKDMGTIADFNKSGKKKPQHEINMKAYGSTATDNLNFYAKDAKNAKDAKDAKDAKNAKNAVQSVHDLSLATYLQVIRHAMDKIPHVPPVYGVEIVRSANAMAAANGMNPDELFLPDGVGQERQLFKAVLNMHKMDLISVPDEILKDFDGYANSKPTLKNVKGEVVVEGKAEWNKLQEGLIKKHLAKLITHLKKLPD